MLFRLLLALSFIGLAACSGGGSSADYVRAPDIDFECDSIQSSHCDSNAVGKTVYMGLTTDLNFDCESEVYNLDPLLFVATFDYSGAATVQNGGTYVWGVVTQWVNRSGGKTLQFEDTDYKICAFLDDNDNGRLDGFESLAEQSFNPSASFYPVSSWIQL